MKSLVIQNLRLKDDQMLFNENALVKCAWLSSMLDIYNKRAKPANYTSRTKSVLHQMQYIYDNAVYMIMMFYVNSAWANSVKQTWHIFLLSNCISLIFMHSFDFGYRNPNYRTISLWLAILGQVAKRFRDRYQCKLQSPRECFQTKKNLATFFAVSEFVIYSKRWFGMRKMIRNILDEMLARINEMKNMSCKAWAHFFMSLAVRRVFGSNSFFLNLLPIFRCSLLITTSIYHS